MADDQFLIGNTSIKERHICSNKYLTLSEKMIKLYKNQTGENTVPAAAVKRMVSSIY